MVSAPSHKLILYIVESPSQIRLKLLSSKWSTVENGIDREKQEKRDAIEERLFSIENCIQQAIPQDETKFRVCYAYTPQLS